MFSVKREASSTSALALTSCVSPEELRREDEATCALSSAKVRFAQDSPLEGDGFEPSVPRKIFFGCPVDPPNSPSAM